MQGLIEGKLVDALVSWDGRWYSMLADGSTAQIVLNARQLGAMGAREVASGVLSLSVTSRRREIAIRQAIGANRTRVIRQMLVESVVLGCIGGVAGLLLWRRRRA